MLFKVTALPLGIAIALASVVLPADTVQAASKSVSDVPTNWRIEQYIAADKFVLWNSVAAGLSCEHHLEIAPGTDEKHENRFVSIFLAAKLAGKEMFVFYDDATCQVISFGLQP